MKLINKLYWWQFYNPKNWIFYNRRKAANKKYIDKDPIQRACRSAHWPWWRCTLFDLGVGMQLK